MAEDGLLSHCHCTELVHPSNMGSESRPSGDGRPRILSNASDSSMNKLSPANGKLMSEARMRSSTGAPIQIKSTLSPVLQRTVQNLSLTYLTLTQILSPIMVRKAHKDAHETGLSFLSSTIVLNTEVAKLTMSCVILVFSYGSLFRFCAEMGTAFLKNKRETLKVCVPALIYVVQNNLYFYALKRVDATLFSISYQLRILTTALLSVLLLRRIFSRTQWVALCISVVGVCFVQLASGSAHSGEKVEDEQFLGLITIFVMCWTSAFAGVYLEGVLKQSSCDIWTQNIRLSVITLPFALLTVANDVESIRKNGLYQGWTWLLWFLVLSSASSGLVVAAVMKYADNIKKSYCQSIALGGTALISILMGDAQFSFSLLMGVSLVIASVFLYTLNPPKIKARTPDLSEEDTIGLLNGEQDDPSMWEYGKMEKDLEQATNNAKVEKRRSASLQNEVEPKFADGERAEQPNVGQINSSQTRKSPPSPVVALPFQSIARESVVHMHRPSLQSADYVAHMEVVQQSGRGKAFA